MTGTSSTYQLSLLLLKIPYPLRSKKCGGSFRSHSSVSSLTGIILKIPCKQPEDPRGRNKAWKNISRKIGDYTSAD
jgi:hypothetical protein